MYIYKIIILCGLLLGSVGLKAQEAQCSIDRKLRADSTNRNRIITRATMYGVGFTNVFDTYLSPQEYKGIDFRISRESMRMTRLMGGNVSLQTFFQADLGYTHNKVDNNNTFSGLANWNYGLHYNFPITSNFKLLAGGGARRGGGIPAFAVRQGGHQRFVGGRIVCAGGGEPRAFLKGAQGRFRFLAEAAVRPIARQRKAQLHQQRLQRFHILAPLA